MGITYSCDHTIFFTTSLCPITVSVADNLMLINVLRIENVEQAEQFKITYVTYIQMGGAMAANRGLSKIFLVTRETMALGSAITIARVIAEMSRTDTRQFTS